MIYHLYKLQNSIIKTRLYIYIIGITIKNELIKVNIMQKLFICRFNCSIVIAVIILTKWKYRLLILNTEIFFCWN